MRIDTIITDEQNLSSSKTSGSEILNANNSALKHRQRQPSVQSQSTVDDQFINQNKSGIITCGRCSILIVSIFMIILVFGIYFKHKIYIPGILFEPKPIKLSSPNATAILLIGKTGCGKSTLGNLLLKTSKNENPTFNVSNSFSSVTKKADFAFFQIENEIYNIVDTPGIFDTDDLNEVVLEEIARTIQKCIYGIKAILFVFEAKRYTKEQAEMVDRIKLFLGDEALQYMITVFSHCDKKQTEDLEHFKTSWNQPIKAFVNSMGNRWAISPNPDIFPPDNLVHQQRLGELKNHIISINGVYTNELLENARKEQEENARILREAEEERQREYDELKRKEGEAIAWAKYVEKKAEDEKKANEKHNEELKNIKKSLLEQINDLKKEMGKLAEVNEILSNDRANYEKLKKEYERKADENYEKLKKESDEKHNEELKSLLDQINHLSMRIADTANRRETIIYRDSGGCFGLETQIKLESGRIIQMSELQTGDRVLSNIRNGIAEYSEVYLIAHIGKLEHEEEFARVSFTRPDGSKGQLRLTITHYVFDENLSIKFAKDLRPGETKILVSDDNNKLVSVFVDDVTTELHDKYISFYTRAGSVIANGVLCSCYDQCPPSQTFMDMVFLPVRWWTYIIPSTHRGERLHPYVRFLEMAYLLFTNSMEKGKRLIEN
ncbi:unnamed protein product [Rhizophagus irregularis]|uniref:AIG1-type G domain-containing protein n=1 Tax=Rhizophagus irregularis TaxID=588596 RepID=A0A915YRI1_9GLOM|nr:unnamed protein product [Rhizophagus irregularis]CAB5217290.1 unnamed protein product [Rhizophagus irregularis]CAB5313341.1 unnamed protein product [Rhizophagus irregularis]